MNHTDRFVATAAARIAADINRLISAGVGRDQAVAAVRERTIAGPKVWAAVFAGEL